MTQRGNQTPNLDRLITIHIPGPSTVNTYGERIPGPETDYRVWAQRRDLTATDQIDIDNSGFLIIQVTRLTIRYRADVQIGFTLTDDKNGKRTIIGMAEIGRRQYIELLAEAIT